MILVAGPLTLQLAFDDHLADAKKKKSYKKHSSSKSTKKAEIEAVGGHGGSLGAGGISCTSGIGVAHCGGDVFGGNGADGASACETTDSCFNDNGRSSISKQ